MSSAYSALSFRKSDEQSYLLEWHVRILGQSQKNDTLKAQSRELIADSTHLWCFGENLVFSLV